MKGDNMTTSSDSPRNTPGAPSAPSGISHEAGEAYLRSYIPTRLLAPGREAARSSLIRDLIKNVPRLPVFAVELLAILNVENTSADDVIRLANEDPAIVAEILKTVNSARYGLARRVEDFKMAVVMLGFDEIQRIALSASIQKTMPDNPSVQGMLDRSIAVSRMAHDLATAFRLPRVGAISVAGLLHGIGGSLVYLIKRKNPRLEPMLNLIDTSEVGALLLESWELPPSIIEMVRHQSWPCFTRPQDLPEAIARPLLAIHFALLCDASLSGTEDAELPAGFAAEHLAFLGRPERTVREILSGIVLQSLRKTKYQFTSPLGEK